MTFSVLIVEDDPEFVAELRDVFAKQPGTSDVQVASSRDAAIRRLQDDFFDLIILDLRIPTVDGAVDAAPEHGHAVFARARTLAPGTPVFVLTGSPVEDFVPAMLQQARQVDIWGEGRTVGTIAFLGKLKFDECPAKLAPIVAAVHALSNVELDRGGVNLTLQEDRIIRIFARRFHGTRCAISQLSGGLSGTKVLRLRITNNLGVQIHNAVAKLGSPDQIQDEALRVDMHVSRLDPRATPRQLGTLNYGAGAIAGIFYGLADGYESSAFDIARLQDGRAAASVSGVEAALARWSTGVPETRRSIAAVRQRVLSDAGLEQLLLKFPLDWVLAFEANEIQTRWSCVHGDLYGHNVLLKPDGTAVLIDYGDVAEGPASLDPVTLELSLMFHKASVPLVGWPTVDQARQWGNLDAYIVGCPAAEFVRACRAWAARAGAGQREIAAVAYSYLVRQLKYEDTDKELILAVLAGVRRFYEAT